MGGGAPRRRGLKSAAFVAAGLCVAGILEISHSSPTRVQQNQNPTASAKAAGRAAGQTAGVQGHKSSPVHGKISASPTAGHARGGAHRGATGHASGHPGGAPRRVVKATAPPAAPMAVRARGNPATLSWNSSAASRSAASTYRVIVTGRVAGRAYRYAVSTSATSVKLPLLPRGRSYAVKIVARNALGRAARTTTVSLPFLHPGIMMNGSQLAFLKRKIAADQEPWASAYSVVSHQRYVQGSYQAHPASTLTRRNSSATNLASDDIAAYTNALVYYISGNSTYADRAISILNGWARTLKSVAGDAQLDAVWASEVMPRAADIIRSTYRPAAGHPALDVSALNRLFTNVFLPQLSPASDGYRWSNGNWGASMADGTINIGVFTRATGTFDRGVQMWRQRIRSYMYLSSDGPTPIAPPGGAFNTARKVNCFWASRSANCTLPSGWHIANHQSQETCRDMNHTVLGSEALMQAAETARSQGVDLYGEEASRIIGAYEFTAKYDLQALNNPVGSGNGRVSDNVCGGTLHYGGIGWETGFVTVYNEFHNRLGYSMPYTQKMMARIASVTHKPGAGLVAALDVAWTGLTNLRTP